MSTSKNRRRKNRNRKNSKSKYRKKIIQLEKGGDEKELYYFCAHALWVHHEFEKRGYPKLSILSGIPSNSVTFGSVVRSQLNILQKNKGFGRSLLTGTAVKDIEPIHAIFLDTKHGDIVYFWPKNSFKSDKSKHFPHDLWERKRPEIRTAFPNKFGFGMEIRDDVLDAYLLMFYDEIRILFPKARIFGTFTALQKTKLGNPPPGWSKKTAIELFRFVVPSSAAFLATLPFAELDIPAPVREARKSTHPLNIALSLPQFSSLESCAELIGSHFRNLFSSRTSHDKEYRWNVLTSLRKALCSDWFLSPTHAQGSELSSLANLVTKNVSEHYKLKFNSKVDGLEDWKRSSFQTLVFDVLSWVTLLPQLEQVAVLKSVLNLGNSFCCHEILNQLANAAYQSGMYQEAAIIEFTCTYLGIPSLELGRKKHQNKKKHDFNLAAIKCDADLVTLCYYMSNFEERLLRKSNIEGANAAKEYFRLLKREALFFAPYVKSRIDPDLRRPGHPAKFDWPDKLAEITSGLHSNHVCNSNKTIWTYVLCEQPHFEGSLGLLSDACDLFRMELNNEMRAHPAPNYYQLASRLDLIEILTSVNTEFLQEELSDRLLNQNSSEFIKDRPTTADIEEIKYQTISGIQHLLEDQASKILGLSDLPSGEHNALLWQLDETLRNKSIIPFREQRFKTLQTPELLATHDSGLDFSDKLIDIASRNSSAIDIPFSRIMLETFMLTKFTHMHLQFWSSAGILHCSFFGLSPEDKESSLQTFKLGGIDKYQRLRDELRDTILAGDHSKEARNEIRGALSELGRSLISPVLEGAPRPPLICMSISECAELCGIPWSAVLFEGKALINSFEVSVVPSFKFLIHSLTEMRNTLISDYRIAHLVDVAHSDLIGVSNESELLQDNFGQEYEAANNPEDMKRILKETCWDGQGIGKKRPDEGERWIRNSIIHVSGHGHFLGANPFDSYFSLAPENQFPTKEFIAINLTSVFLVFLNTCESGRSKSMPGNDFIGLQFPFIRKGVPNVIQTLFPVDDLFANQFSDKFYSILLSGKKPVEAFRETQLHFQEHDTEDKSALPRWAAYQICGAR